MALTALLREPTSLTRPCAADHTDGCHLTAQLQRIFVRTPPASAPLALCPKVSFAPPDVLLATTGDDAPTSAEGAPVGGGGGVFGAEASVVLPPDALVCLRLPYVYCEPAGGAALLTAATAAEPAQARRAVLEAGWLKVV